MQSDTTNIEELELVRAYETLNHYRSKVFMNIQRVTIRGNEIEYINNKPNDSFIEENETEQFNSMVEVLTQKDYFIGSEVFDFKRSFLRPENRDEISKKATAIYNYIKEDFFELKNRRLSSGENVKQVLRTYPIPNPSTVINFLSPANHIEPEKRAQQVQRVDGTLKFS